MTDTGYSRSPKLLKGAIIQFKAPMLVPIPNLILFQYNPDSMARTLHPWKPLEREVEYDKAGTGHMVKLTPKQQDQLAQPFDPEETFSVTLELDATDGLEDPEHHPLAYVSGVADRIAALEMLLYPPGASAIGKLLTSIGLSIGGKTAAIRAQKEQLRRRQVPIVLFFWGPGRIVPVRITSFSVEEQQFSPILYPIRATATIGMQVLTEQDLMNVEGVRVGGEGSEGLNTATVKLAKGCAKFNRVQKELLATANIANSIESVRGMLPF